MKLTLYKYSGELNKIDKSNRLVKLIDLQGFFREETSITRPSIVIEYGGPLNYIKAEDNYVLANGLRLTGAKLNDVIVECNYTYIEELHRYYYVKEIKSVNNRMWRIDLLTDVLMTYKDKILDSYCVVERQENEYDPLIIDEFEPTQDVMKTSKINLPCESPFLGNLASVKDLYPFVFITTAWNLLSGGASVDIGTNNPLVYAKTNPYIPQQSNSIFFGDRLSIEYLFGYQFNIEIEIGNKKVPIMEIIPSAYYYPIDFSKMFKLDKKHTITFLTNASGEVGDRRELIFYSHTLNYIDGTTFTTSFQYEFVNVKLSTLLGDSNTFRLVKPYSTYSLYIPYLGFNDIDMEEFLVKFDESNNPLDNYFRINLVFDLLTNSMTAVVGITKAQNISLDDVNLGKVIHTFSGSCGVTLTTSTSNYQNLQQNLISSSIGASVKGAGALATIGLVKKFATATGAGPIMSSLAIAGSVLNFAGATADAIIHSKDPVSVQNTNPTGPIDKIYLPTKPFLIKKSKVPVIDTIADNTYKHTIGLPLQKSKQLGLLSGYTKCVKANIHGLDNATSEEINDINTLLNAGVII